jgi:hypothetical protein
MRRTLAWTAMAALGMLLPARALALEARVLTASDVATMGGTDFDGGAGDLLLRNDKVEAVILAIGSTPDFDIPLSPEALPSRGVIVDLGTVGDKNDQMNELHQVLNLDGKNFIDYVGTPVLANDANEASITVSGVAHLNVPGAGTFTLQARTTYAVRPGEPWIDLTTSVTNSNPVALPVFSIADVDVLAARSLLPFQPFPDRGTKLPPLDLGDPIPAVGVWPYLVLAGNNGPADGPTNSDLSPCGAVTYTFLADSPLTPFVGVADDLVAAVGNFFDLAAVAGNHPPMLAAGDTLTFHRRLVVTPENSVESGVDVAMPILYGPLFGGFDARATFLGRVVDGAGNPVPDAHIVLDNTFPGSPDFRPLVTLLDEDQDGTPDGLIPAMPGAPLPTTHVVTDAAGRFEVELQAFADPFTATTVYRGRIQAPERATKTFGPLDVDLSTIAGGPNDVGDIMLSDTGTLRFTVRDAATGKKLPAKLVFYGTGGTENPDFGSQYLSLRNFSGLSKAPGDGLAELGEGNTKRLSETVAGTPALNFAMSAGGTGSLQIKPGTYKVYASRGLEYTIDHRSFRIRAGDTMELTLSLKHVVDTTGFVSADFHVHSNKSWDSSTPLGDRLISFAAEGVDVLVATDHDFITGLSPVIEMLGLKGKIAAISGEEMSGGLPVPVHPVMTGGVDAFPEGIGHWNAWPLTPNPGARRNGAPSDEFLNPATAIDRLRGVDSLALLGKLPDTADIPEWLAAIQAGHPGTPGAALPLDEEVVILNHARSGLDGLVVVGLFNSLFNPGGDPTAGGYDPTKPITEFPNNLMLLPSLYSKAVVGPYGTDTNGLSFDAMELINGGGMSRFQPLRTDWFSLLDQGIRRTGVANSDSHRVVMELPGFGRNFVASHTDDPGAIDQDELAASVKTMKIVGTTGPFIRFSIKGDHGYQGLGETVVATKRVLLLHIRVEAAPWVPVEEVRVLRNGNLFATYPIPNRKVLGTVERFNKTLVLDRPDADSYFTVEASVKIDASGTPLNPALLELMHTVAAGVTPLGFTNPIFVDVGGDGYDPPGLRPTNSGSARIRMLPPCKGH